MHGRTPPVTPARVMALVVVLTGTAAWLGVSQAPTTSNRPGWARLVHSTTAAGSLAFSSVTVTSGAVNSVERDRGLIDFSRRDATEVSVVRSRQLSAQWNEVAVVGSTAYERSGTDLPDGHRFEGAWTRLATFAVAPLPALVGSDRGAVPIGGPTLTRVATATIGDTTTVEYRLSPVSITCLDANGGRRVEMVESSAWVDAQGRIRRFADLTTVAVGSFKSTVFTVTDFGRFGTAVSVTAPNLVGGSDATRSTDPGTDALAGCLVTPR
ncbi:MAG TPA: hypothetical protein VMB82_06580 [Acidimicrobiales bacterium]|nr:hypothetical protein [Acidimicrobiales bacterium]